MFLHYNLRLLTFLLRHHGSSVFTSYFLMNVFLNSQSPASARSQLVNPCHCDDSRSGDAFMGHGTLDN